MSKPTLVDIIKAGKMLDRARKLMGDLVSDIAGEPNTTIIVDLVREVTLKDKRKCQIQIVVTTDEYEFVTGSPGVVK